MENFIKKMTEDDKKLYLNNYTRMLSYYNLENDIVQGYNGRQLLELLQNCDDEICKNVCIELNEKKGLIAIHNDGNSFSKEGYLSLSIPYSSPKASKRKFIGYKGLGFRSIIIWSNIIEIQSNNLSLTYSDENRKNNFNSLFDDVGLQKEIRSKQNLSDDVYPIPFLSLPRVKFVRQNKFATSIIVYYKKEFINDIKKQLEAITPEIILFLKNIEKIEFKGIDKKDIICTKTEIIKKTKYVSPQKRIDFDDSSWLIFEEENILPSWLQDKEKNEEEFYQIKIAVEKNFKLTSPFLYSFFPTKIRLEQPYILHATFDLDTSRNQINDSPKNKYLLQKIVDFTISVAKYYSRKKVTYRPLEVIHHKHKADTLYSFGYYDLVRDAIKTEAIFPCIDNTYRTQEQVIYVSDNFAQILFDVGDKFLPFHLIPKGKCSKDFIDNLKVNGNLSKINNIIDVLNSISSHELSTIQRTRYIYELSIHANFLKNNSPDQLMLLTNPIGELIRGSEYIYTPITRGKKLKIPSFANIQFINQELFDELINIFNFESSDENDPARFIAKKLKGFCNIHSYEPANLAQKIISETNHAIKKNIKNKLPIIQEMNKSLFYNFLLQKDTTKLPMFLNIPSISQSGKKTRASDLVLSAKYPTGKNTRLIFKDIYSKKDFVASPKKLGLDSTGVDIEDLERFLVWIGINKYAKYGFKENVDNGISDYVYAVLESNNHKKFTNYSISYKYIKEIENILDNISLEGLIAWVYVDHELKTSLDDKANKDIFEFFYHTFRHISEKQSFIKYTMLKYYKYDFQDYLIDEKFSWVNPHPINYSNEVFRILNISKTEINEILIKLGATDDFLNLSIEKVAKILNLLPEKYPTGNKSQTVYKLALTHYKEHKEELKNTVQLFADDGNELKLFPQEKIYYSDQIKLPKRLYNDFPIFNFPSRAGGAEAIKFFGINDLKEIKISIVDQNIDERLSSSFDSYLIELKPLILACRINDIDETNQRKANASICSKLKIILCTSLTFKVKDTQYELSDYEYIHKEEYIYFIRVNQSDSKNRLKQEGSFIKSFADIISISFDVFGDMDKYRYLLRSNIKDFRDAVIDDYGIDNYNEAKALLGLADNKQAFWAAVFVSKGKEYEHNLDDKSLEDIIIEELGVNIDVAEFDYENLNREDQIVKVQNLFFSIKLELSDFNKNYVSEISLKKIHSDRVKNEILKLKPSLKKALWYYLNQKPISDQEKFLDKINEIEHYYDYAESISDEYKYVFEINAPGHAKEYLKKIYGDLDYNVEEVDLNEIYKTNMNLFSQKELDFIEEDLELKSLLYFKQSLSKIKDKLQNDMKGEDENHIKKISDLDNDLVLANNPVIVPIDDSQSPDRQRNKGVYTHSQAQNKIKKQKGDSLESLVFNYMKKNQYKDVDWVSRDNEGLHCDIRYTGEDSRVKFVEVKAFDNNYFYLTKEEYDFGESEKDNYEIWLVIDYHEINIIKDFFQNPKYRESMEDDRYKIKLKIEKDSE